jgi:hypothetical protein
LKAESKKDDLSRYRRIFADFFVGAAAAEAHWYSIKTLHNDIPTLASLLGVSQENLNILLVLSGFGITLHKIGTDDQPADILTQPLPYEAFVKHGYSLLGWSTTTQLQRPVTRSSTRECKIKGVSVTNIALKPKKAIRSRRNRGNKGGNGR